MPEKGVTATTRDIAAAIRKRTVNQGIFMTNDQIHTLAVDIMNVINTDAANATANAATEIASNIVRPFVPGV